MSKEDFKKFIRQSRDFRLSENEKDSLRSKILEFISFNPIRGTAPIVRERSYISIFEVRHFMKAASLVLIIAVVVGGSGISYAASNALPGEALYAVKVNINENIEETLATTPKAKLAIQSEHIQRRLDEVQTLRKDGKLSSGAQKIVIAKLDEHTQEASKSIEILKEKGDVSTVLEATSSLTPIFEANKEILEKDSTKKDSESEAGDAKAETEVLIAKIDDSNQVFKDQEDAVIASVEVESDPAVATMSIAMTKTVEPDPAIEAEKAAQKATDKAASQVREIGRQIADVVEERIDSAKDKIAYIKTDMEKEEALAKQKEAEAQATLETQAETAIDQDVTPTAIDPTINIPIKMSDISLATKGSIKVETVTTTPTEAQVKASETILEEKTETAPVKTESTDSFDTRAKIEYAESLIKEAEKLLENKSFKEALMKAQEVNHIAAEIETHRRLEALDLAKEKKIESTLKATVAESTKSN